MLRETATTGTMAVVANACLVLDYDPFRCGLMPHEVSTGLEDAASEQVSVFETALAINDDMRPKGPRKLKDGPLTSLDPQPAWDISSIGTHCSLPLGTDEGKSGELTVVSDTPQTGLLLVEWTSSNLLLQEWRKKVKESLFRKESRKYHEEYIFEGSCDKLVVHVVSKGDLCQWKGL